MNKGQPRDEDQADSPADPGSGPVETDQSPAEKAAEVAAEKEQSGAENAV
jgi:hypothetical protein